MDSFDVIISPNALSQLNRYIDYIQYTLLNVSAAGNVWQGALETRKRLSLVAASLLVYVDAIYHQLQDYENTFIDEFKITD